VAISPDNLTLYFASERPGGEGDKDLYQATRVSVNDDWGNVMSLGTGINTSAFEANPGITEDGTTLYFTSDRAGGEGGFDIWFATRESTTEEFGDVQNLGPAI
jgi:peptidoglycan-associated lipoprotein